MSIIKKIKVVEKGSHRSVWGSLTKICQAYGIKYSEVRTASYPIRIDGFIIYNLDYNEVGDLKEEENEEIINTPEFIAGYDAALKHCNELIKKINERSLKEFQEKVR